MSQPSSLDTPCELTLWAETASDLMMPNPMSLRADSTIREAITALIDHGFSAAPVIDEAGHPVGVLSRADILLLNRDWGLHALPVYYEQADLASHGAAHERQGFPIEKASQTLVRDIMTPAIYAVAPDTPAARVVQQMLALKVHRLFVVEADGTLVGVISALDVLRHLRP